MFVLVQEFSGACTEDAERIKKAAALAVDAWQSGKRVVVVVSTSERLTRELLTAAMGVSLEPDRRELDVLLAACGQETAALMAMAVESLGAPAVSYIGFQIGMLTDSNHGSARIKSLSTQRIRRALDQNRIVVVSGFQGMDDRGDLTTFSEDGTVATAEAIALALGDAECELYSQLDTPPLRTSAAAAYSEEWALAGAISGSEDPLPATVGVYACVAK